MAKRLAKRYEFLSILGRGGAGTVYEVMNLALKRKEAFKVLAESQEEDFSRRFAQEAKVAASLDHPRIVKIYDFGRSEGAVWYSMQLVDGPTLANIIEGSIRMDQVSMVRLAVPLLDALDYSHSRGVVHRDIKPANILINTDGRPYLTDFGIAKTDDSVLKTLTGHMMGTPAYVSPEQALGKPVDARTDLYSLAVTLYQLLAGRLPFSAESTLQTVVMRLNEPPEPILDHCPALDPGLAACIMKALLLDREERWASATEMRSAIQNASGACGIAWDKPLADVSVLRQLLPAKMRTKPLSDLSPTLPVESSGEEPTGRKKIAWMTVAALIPIAIAGLWLGLRKAPGSAGIKAAQGEALAEPAPTNSSVRIPPVKIEPRMDHSTQPPSASPPAHPTGPGHPDANGNAMAAKDAQPGRPVTAPQPDSTPPPGLKAAPGCAGQSIALSVVVSAEGRVKSSRVLSQGQSRMRKGRPGSRRQMDIQAGA